MIYPIIERGLFVENLQENTVTIAGFFTHSQLSELLEELRYCGGITVLNFEKSLHLRFEKNFWIGVNLKELDPSKELTFQDLKVFLSAENVAYFVQESLGNSFFITFKFSNGNDNNSISLPTSYLKLVQNEPSSLLREKGFLYIFFQPQDILHLLLQSIITNNNTIDDLALALINLCENNKAFLISSASLPHFYNIMQIICRSQHFKSVVDILLDLKHDILSLISIIADKDFFENLIQIIAPGCSDNNADYLKRIVRSFYFKENLKNAKTQNEIINKLSRYVAITSPSGAQKLQKDLEDSKGVCFGLAVCHGAMDVTGYLDWWETALLELLKWDETRSSLETEVTLPGSRAKTSSEKKLNHIFNKILNFIIFDQAVILDGIKSFFPENISQAKFLTKGNYFSIIDKNNKIRQVENSKTIAGYFTKEVLMDILDEKEIEDTICIVSTTNHAIRIGYKNNTWIYYDSEDDHSSLPSIHKTFTKIQLVETLLDRVDSCFTITAASLDKKKSIHFSKYDKLLKNPITAANLLKKNGLSLIANYTPIVLETILKQIKNYTQGSIILANALQYHHTEITQQGKLLQCNGLYVLVTRTKHLLPKILDLLDKTPIGIDSLALAVSNGAVFEYLCASYISFFSGNNDNIFPKIISIIESSPKAPDALANALGSDETIHWYKVPCLSTVVSIVAKSNKAPDRLIKAFKKPAKIFFDNAITHFTYESRCFAQIIEIITKSPSSIQEFKRAVLPSFPPNSIALHAPAQLSSFYNQEELKTYILELLNNKNFFKALQQKRNIANIEKVFELIFDVIKMQDNAADFFCSLNLCQDLLFLMAEFSSNSLSLAFTLIRQTQFNLQDVLNLSKEGGWTILYTIACYLPESLNLIDAPVLNDLAKDCINKKINLFDYLEKNHPINLPKLYKALSDHIKNNLITELKDYLQNKIQPSFWHSKTSQSHAISKMVLQLQCQKTEDFLDEEIEILDTGILGDIINKYRPTGIIPKEFTMAENCRSITELHLYR